MTGQLADPSRGIAFVTGGTGLLGSRLIFDLLSGGWKVRAIKRRTSSTRTMESLFKIWGDGPQNLFSCIEWRDGDVLDKSSILEAASGASRLYHCAAMVSFEPEERTLMMDVNVRGTANAVSAALECKVGKSCFASSVAALGRGDPNRKDQPVDENCDWLPLGWNSSYSESKHLAEKEVWRGIEAGMKAVVVNPSIILGAGDPVKSSARIFHVATKGNPFYTDGWSGFVDVRDVSRAMIELAGSQIEAERFIVSEGNHSYKELFELLAKHLGRRPPFIRLGPAALGLAWRLEKARSIVARSKPVITRETARTASSRHLYSNEKIRKSINFEFTPLEKSIEDNSRFFKLLFPSG